MDGPAELNKDMKYARSSAVISLPAFSMILLLSAKTNTGKILSDSGRMSCPGDVDDAQYFLYADNTSTHFSAIKLRTSLKVLVEIARMAGISVSSYNCSFKQILTYSGIHIEYCV